MRNRIFSSQDDTPTAAPEFNDGREAYRLGFSFSDCPHARGSDWNQHRYNWFMGFLNARHEHLL
jgi:hypothetical protein